MGNWPVPPPVPLPSLWPVTGNISACCLFGRGLELELELEQAVARLEAVG